MAALLLAGCRPATGDRGRLTTAENPPATLAPAASAVPAASRLPPTPTPPGPAVVDLTVVLYDYAFQPSVLEVPAGAPVRLTVVNRGSREHAWVLMEKDYVWESPFDAEDSGHGIERVTIDVLEREVLTFTAPSLPGEYNVVCSIVGHVEFGMVATLIVR